MFIKSYYNYQFKLNYYQKIKTESFGEIYSIHHFVLCILFPEQIFQSH